MTLLAPPCRDATPMLTLFYGLGVLSMSEFVAEWHNIVLRDPPPLENIGPLPAKDIFFGGPRQEAAFGGAAGLVQAPPFTAAELGRIKELIQAQLVENARAFSAEMAEVLAVTTLERYHEVATPENHPHLLSKLGRVMSAEAVAEIKTMSPFAYIQDAFGDHYLSDEEKLGHEQICFRIVRPNIRADVGSLHRDAWFWDMHKFEVPEGWGRAKMWVSVCGEPGKANLLLAHGSHLDNTGFDTATIDGKLEFLPRTPPEEIDLRRFMGGPGAPVMFNYQTLHVGAVNKGEQSRVSFEITVMFREDSGARAS